jgi:hypothetical protein
VTLTSSDSVCDHDQIGIILPPLYGIFDLDLAFIGVAYRDVHDIESTRDSA